MPQAGKGSQGGVMGAALHLLSSHTPQLLRLYHTAALLAAAAAAASPATLLLRCPFGCVPEQRAPDEDDAFSQLAVSSGANHTGLHPTLVETVFGPQSHTGTQGHRNAQSTTGSAEQRVLGWADAQGVLMHIMMAHPLQLQGFAALAGPALAPFPAFTNPPPPIPTLASISAPTPASAPIRAPAPSSATDMESPGSNRSLAAPPAAPPPCPTQQLPQPPPLPLKAQCTP